MIVPPGTRHSVDIERSVRPLYVTSENEHEIILDALGKAKVLKGIYMCLRKSSRRVSFDVLEESVWGIDQAPEIESIRTNVKRLQRKFSNDPVLTQSGLKIRCGSVIENKGYAKYHAQLLRVDK